MADLWTVRQARTLTLLLLPQQAALRDAGALPQLVQLLKHTDNDGADGRATIKAAEALRSFADGPANRTAIRWDTCPGVPCKRHCKLLQLSASGLRLNG